MDDRVPEHRDSHASSSRESIIFRAYACEKCGFGVSTVFALTSLKTDIARSARGPKLQGPRAEDALAEPYLVQKFFW